MLIEFSVGNFRSFGEQQTLSMVASNSDKTHLTNIVDPALPGLKGVKLVRGAALYGANASGKSNVVKAIMFSRWFIVSSFSKLSPGEETGTEPNKMLTNGEQCPSNFGFIFVHKGIRYSYYFSMTTERVIEEELIAYPKGLPQRWFRRQYDAQTDSYLWNVASSFRRDQDVEERTRPNTLFVSTAAQFNHEQVLPVFEWFQWHLRVIDMAGPGLYHGFTARQIKKSAQQRGRILQALNDVDLRITDIDVEEIEPAQQEIESIRRTAMERGLDVPKTGDIEPYRKTSIIRQRLADNELVRFDLQDDESVGTQRFFSLIGPWIDILEHGFTVFIDELEVSLHPKLVAELLRLMFHNTSTVNPAQLVFTTQNASLLGMNLMRRDQIWFTEKDNSLSTTLYPLTDFSPKRDESIFRGYMSGRYGAVPILSQRELSATGAHEEQTS